MEPVEMKVVKAVAVDFTPGQIWFWYFRMDNGAEFAGPAKDPLHALDQMRVYYDTMPKESTT